MSSDGVPVTSAESSGPQGTGEQNTGRPARGKQRPRPRKQQSGSSQFGASLTSDRTKAAKSGEVSSEKGQRPPRKPPGLSTPPENRSENGTRPGEEQDGDDELCFICGNSMKDRYYSLAPCNNAFCHNCSLRLRALYKSTNCPFCKTEHETVIFTGSSDKSFADFSEYDFKHKDQKLGILFETEQILEDSMFLLRFNCPDPSCDVACRNWSALKAHVKATHHRYLCSLCTQHKKVFTHEQILYSSRELTTHFATGDPVKDISMTGFTGHPKCKFCNQAFYSQDEFIQHNREKHERCHVCDRINSRRGIPEEPRYFVNYDELWKHFQSEHFPCGAVECLEQKFVVFESDIDLKAHIMEVHMGRASKAELRDMSRVELNFQYSTPGRGRQRREREEERPPRDVDISTLPRDEQAYFRIQQAQRDLASRQIGRINIPPPRQQRDVPTEFPPLGSGVSESGPSNAPRARPVESFPPLGGATPSTPTKAPAPEAAPAPSSSLPPEVAARHATVLQKAGQLLNNDSEKIAQFKRQVSSFRHSESTATELIDTLWDIFNAKLEEFGKLITSTADLFDYDAKPKRTELLGAWNDWKIQMQEDNSAASTGFLPQQGQRSRILALKSSAKGRSKTTPQNVWNRIEAVAASRPVTSTSSSSVARRLGGMSLNSSGRPSVPWTGTSASISAAPPQKLAVPAARNTVAPPRSASEEFPSLPSTKPREKINLNAAAAPARPVTSWAPDNRPSAPPQNNVPENMETSKGKGKKKGKTVLFHVG